MTITENQALVLSNLLHEIRPEWVPKSLMTLIRKHRDEHEFADLCTAAVAVAKNPTKGPAIIFMDGPHWPGTSDIPHYWRSPNRQPDNSWMSDPPMATGTRRALEGLQIAQELADEEQQALHPLEDQEPE